MTSARLDERKRYKEIMDMVMTANEVFISENVDKVVTFYLNEFGLKVSIYEDVLNREKSNARHYFTNETSYSKVEGYIYDPRLDAAEARIREVVAKVIENIGKKG